MRPRIDEIQLRNPRNKPNASSRGCADGKYGLSKQIDEPYGVLSFVPECEFERNIQLPDSVGFVFVAAYKGQSGLRDKAAQRGIKCVDGLEMLYHQGAKSFALWTGTEVRDDYDGF